MKPFFLTPDFGGIPDFLRKIPHWVLWSYIPHRTKPDKWVKGPFDAKRPGKHASTSNPTTWCDFATCEQAYLAGHGDGVGLVNNGELGQVWIDFDKCRLNEDWTLKPEIEDYLKRIEGYCEVSPSDNGLHLIVVSDTEAVFKNDSMGIEVYPKGRYFTVTGRPYNGFHVEALENQDLSWFVAELCEKKRAGVPLDSASPNPLHERHIAGTSMLARPEKSNPEIERIYSALDCLGAAGYAVDYNRWIDIGILLKHACTAIGIDGRELWHRFSAYDADQYDFDEADHKWNTFPDAGDRSGEDSLFWKATSEGWMDPHPEVEQDKISGTFEIIEAPIVGIPAVESNQEDETDWPAFTRGKGGVILPNINNTMLALLDPGNCLGVRFGLDSFRDEIVIAPAGTPGAWRPIQDHDLNRLICKMERMGFKKPPIDEIRRCVNDAAERLKFDSAQAWLSSLCWDGVPRIGSFLPTYARTQDTEYARAVSLYLWTALAGRVMDPGCQADMVPVLIGAQGVMKSTLVRTVAPYPEYATEIALSTRDETDTQRKMRGVVIAELPELKGLRTAEQESVKAFLTRRDEKWVEKWKTYASTYPRRFIFVGTTNEDDILEDVTGNRRWLPIRVGRCNVDLLTKNCFQLWAEAREVWNVAGVCWQEAERLAVGEHQEFEANDDWSPRVASWLLNRTSAEGPLRTCDILRHALDVPPAQQTRNLQMRANNVMKRLGYTQTRERIDGVLQRIWIL
jgi:hypothetical protein